MTLITFLVAWFIATVGMTLFSAVWSRMSKNQFREPALLSLIIASNSNNDSIAVNAYKIGWLSHILLGAVFLGVYEILWLFTGLERNFLWAFLFGSGLGVLGIVGWMFMFKTIRDEFEFNYLHYYVHLYFAHLVFSFLALLSYFWFQ
ncbi:hypothetical protein ESY86_06875 [Subsaximicrobium wynnwilliamsii]|uniref:DUF2938 domain-containing protein n=1 Tax=Subsaximicrobium wynnwilliamsii TaxID=291179 RepID=A0A5C6ZJF1_9FLAO|nr:hypothetical protein [Subsaximicrobium wynnwilliamsii]TXD81554.1 hypothetical protein ESY87_17490 [Subsaximicrobium wynnwilliamsii]TXD89916.1 hypothetical protein ESY86_06875 [Subsaximicrobium wynnwilliamsii]TXE01015.1 hypothetical protein ESY88_17485 [Subsaximicrobium wynnwilliamsii]